MKLGKNSTFGNKKKPWRVGSWIEIGREDTWSLGKNLYKSSWDYKQIHIYFFSAHESKYVPTISTLHMGPLFHNVFLNQMVYIIKLPAKNNLPADKHALVAWWQPWYLTYILWKWVNEIAVIQCVKWYSPL